MCILPSSLTRVLSSALDFSSHLPVSVYGTVFISLTLDSISWHHDYTSFASTFFPLASHLTSVCGFAYRPQKLGYFDRDNRRPAWFHLMRLALETNKGSGIWTGFPSATTFVLALGADLPWADYLYPGNLRFSADGDLTRLFVTYTCILTSNISSKSYNLPSSTYGTLPYHLTHKELDPKLRYIA